MIGSLERFDNEVFNIFDEIYDDTHCLNCGKRIHGDLLAFPKSDGFCSKNCIKEHNKKEN